MTNTDPVCPNCGRYLAHVGPEHMMFCHAPPKPSDSVFAAPLTTSTDTPKRLSDVALDEITSRVAAFSEWRRDPDNEPRSHTHTYQAQLDRAALLSHIVAISKPPSQGKVERAREIAASVVEKSRPYLATQIRSGMTSSGWPQDLVDPGFILQAAEIALTESPGQGTGCFECGGVLNGPYCPKCAGQGTDGACCKAMREAAGHILDVRAAAYGGRSDHIYNGKIMSEELYANAHAIRALGSAK